MNNRPLIIIPLQFHLKWTADYVWQTAKVLQKKHSVIFYNEAEKIFFFKDIFKLKNIFSSKNKSVHFFQPVDFFPFRRFSLVKKINTTLNLLLFRFFLRKLQSQTRKKILWNFHPYDALLSSLFHWADVSLFDCVDYFSSNDQKEDLPLKKLQKKLIEKTQIFTVDSETLLKIHQQKAPHVTLVPKGFAGHDFSPTKTTKKTPTKRKPLIGFVGGLNYRIDFRLLNRLVKNNPQWQFSFWGPFQAVDGENDGENELKKLFALENVEDHPMVRRSKIARVIEKFDVAMIPYNSQYAFNKNCYPMKLLEYFYLGKPVISTPINELKKFPEYVRLGTSAKKWEKNIHYFLKHPPTKKQQQEQRKIALKNSWEKKVKEILKLIDQKSPQQKSQ